MVTNVPDLGEYFIAYNATMFEIGRADTLDEAKKFPGVVVIDKFNKYGGWTKTWEIRNKKWVITIK